MSPMISGTKIKIHNLKLLIEIFKTKKKTFTIKKIY